MADVSTWDPADDNNNKPSPDGFPEFMMPSGVNNSSRAVMGAVRRMYDTLNDGSLALPYLKLSGGQTVTGATTFSAGLTASALTVNSTASIGGALSVTGGASISGAVNTGSSINCVSYSLSGTAFAGRASGDTYVYDNAAQWTFLTRSSPAENHYANSTHYFVARNNASTFGYFNSAGLTVNASLSVGNLITAGSGGVQSNRGDGFAFYAPNGGGSFAGTVSAGGLSSGGDVYAAGNHTGGGVSVGGAVNGNSVGANYITSTGNINAAGQYTGGSMNLGGEVRGGSLATGGGLSVGGTASVSGTATVQHIVPAVDNVGICGGSAAAWQVVESYDFITKSDAALKQDLGPLPDTLALVAAIEPQAFRYGDDPIRHYGFVAQDVRAAIGNLPVDLVRGEEGRLGLDYGGLVAMLWKAVAELATEVQTLRNGGA